MNTKLKLLVAVLLLSTLNSQLSTAHAQGTAFTYQGRLTDSGAPANGLYDLTFSLFNLDTGPGQVGSSVARSATGVTNGLFTVILDFGNNPFATGAPRWLDIAVRTNGSGSFSTLNPRQALTATPYAITASNITGVVSSAGLAGTYSGALSFNNAGNSFAGNGAGLANVNAATLGGYSYCNLPCYWNLTGNVGTIPGVNFLGTTDNQALEFRVNNTRALRIEPNSVPSLVGGYYQNSANGVAAAVIAGGGTSGSINQVLGNYAFIGAGHGAQAGQFAAVVDGAYNVSLGQFSFIGSGLANTNQGADSVIGGGSNNLVMALGDNAFVGGGNNNTANNTHATIGGGDYNIASSWSTVGGGEGNQSSAAFCTVAGGRFNQSEGTYASVGGGYNNHSSGDHAAVAGGFSNVSASPDAAVGGGSNNTIQVNSDASVISGGHDNLIQAGSPNATIAGGALNRAFGPGGGTIGGGGNNFVSDYNTTISGGDNNIADANAAAIGGGSENHASADHSTIGGGQANISSGGNTTVSGGYANTASGILDSTVGGGSFNTSSGSAAVVPGGTGNVASGDSSLAAGSYSTASGFISTALGEGTFASGRAAVAMGSFAAATNSFTMAVGRRAQARHSGSFVWADSTDADFTSTANDQFNIRAANGLRVSDNNNGNVIIQPLGGLHSGFQAINFNGYYDGFLEQERRFNPNKMRWRLLVDQRSTADTMSVDVYDGFAVSNLVTIQAHGNVGIGNSSPANLLVVGSATSPAYCNGTTWVNGSDRNSKQDFAPVNATEVLAKVVSLPLQSWSYKVQPGDKHIGPVAQDFHAAFGLNGSDDKHIATVDESGVALAAIQGLNQKLEQKEAEITQLKQTNESLTTRLDALEKIILNQKSN